MNANKIKNYSQSEIEQTVGAHVQKIFMASTMDDAIKAYLDMENCISKKWIQEYMKRPIVANGVVIRMKDHPNFKKIKEELKKRAKANFEVIMGVSVNDAGEKIYLVNKKTELLNGQNGKEILDSFRQKRDYYDTINKAIKNGELETLENFYSLLEGDLCYKWVIPYYNLKNPVKLVRKPTQKTSLT